MRFNGFKYRSALAVVFFVITHCQPVVWRKNHSRCVIWCSLQMTSKQWIITQQFTATADLFIWQHQLVYFNNIALNTSNTSTKDSKDEYMIMYHTSPSRPFLAKRSTYSSHPTACYYSTMLPIDRHVHYISYTCYFKSSIKIIYTMSIAAWFWSLLCRTFSMLPLNQRTSATLKGF